MIAYLDIGLAILLLLYCTPLAEPELRAWAARTGSPRYCFVIAVITTFVMAPLWPVLIIFMMNQFRRS